MFFKLLTTETGISSKRLLRLDGKDRVGKLDIVLFELEFRKKEKVKHISNPGNPIISINYFPDSGSAPEWKAAHDYQFNSRFVLFSLRV